MLGEGGVRGQEQKRGVGSAKTSLIIPSRNFTKFSRNKKKERPSFGKLLARYKKK